MLYRLAYKRGCKEKSCKDKAVKKRGTGEVDV